MNANKALIITSIFAPNDAMKVFAASCAKKNIQFIVIGDKKSPEEFTLQGCNYYSIHQQSELPFSLSKLLPANTYARKNIGYLIAVSNNVEVIVETDDDNFPQRTFWKNTSINYSSYHVEDHGWLNVYAYFIKQKVWPRAFPLEHINDAVPPLADFHFKENICPVQQGLADDNPDVDAIFRLVNMLPVKFKKSPSIALGKNTMCPFNSQNTKWFKPAFPLLYLPTHCSFRMTDIWRSFVAQRIFWENNWSVLFHKPTVYQLRNDHDILKDFKDEIPGYLNNRALMETLMSLKLKPGEVNIIDNLKKCYDSIIEMGLIGEDEMPLLNAWCTDINELS
jgi:STELLO glycosyltransferase-like protein